MTTPQIINGAITWTGGAAIDSDGSPNAYAMDGSGLDCLANAGHEGNWWALSCNTSGVPYVQGTSGIGPSPGKLISTTALVDHNYPANDTRRFVDSEQVPYLSIARDLTQGASKLRMGDIGLAIFHGKVVGAVCADVGPAGKYGEISIALASLLGIPSSPKHGGVSSGVVYVVFPSSRLVWPVEHEAVDTCARNMFEAWGGMDRVNSLYSKDAAVG